MLPPEKYTGRRYFFESMYNDMGWRLAFLNPEIRNHRGLIYNMLLIYIVTQPETRMIGLEEQDKRTRA